MIKDNDGWDASQDELMFDKRNFRFLPKAGVLLEQGIAEMEDLGGNFTI